MPPVKRSASQSVKAGPSRRSRPNSPLPAFVPPQLSQPVEKPPSQPSAQNNSKFLLERTAQRHRGGERLEGSGATADAIVSARQDRVDGWSTGKAGRSAQAQRIAYEATSPEMLGDTSVVRTGFGCVGCSL